MIAELQDPYGAGSDEGVPMAPGLFVNASIQGDVISDIKIAPRAALRGVDEIYIGDPNAGTLHIRQIDIIYTDAQGTYIAEGVNAGDLAVVSPIQAAFDGMRIKVLERQPDGSVIAHEPDEDADRASDDGAVAEAGRDSEGAIQ